MLTCLESKAYFSMQVAIRGGVLHFQIKKRGSISINGRSLSHRGPCLILFRGTFSAIAGYESDYGFWNRSLSFPLIFAARQTISARICATLRQNLHMRNCRFLKLRSVCSKVRPKMPLKLGSKKCTNIKFGNSLHFILYAATSFISTFLRYNVDVLFIKSN